MSRGCNKKRKELRKWVLKNIIPQCLIDKIRELTKKHEQAFEEKGNRFALFNDDMKDFDKKIKVIKIRILDCRVAQQIEKCETTINHFRKRYGDHARNPSLGNVEMVAC